MSHDSSHLAWLKLVISVNHCVDSELARCKHEKSCFPNLHVNVCSTMVRDFPFCNVTLQQSAFGNCSHGKVRGDNFVLLCNCLKVYLSHSTTIQTDNVVFNQGHYHQLYSYQRISICKHLTHNCSAVRIHAKLLFFEDIVREKLGDNQWQRYIMVAAIFFILHCPTFVRFRESSNALLGMYVYWLYSCLFMWQLNIQTTNAKLYTLRRMRDFVLICRIIPIFRIYTEFRSRSLKGHTGLDSRPGKQISFSFRNT